MNPAAARSALKALADRVAAQWPAGRDRVAQVVDGLDEPVRVGIVGRVSSGKSTLVNAMVGRRVAPTAAQDCTRCPTTYRFGAPESAVAVLGDGTRQPIDLDFATSDAPLPDGTVAVDVQVQSAALERVTVVDTPGVQGTIIDADEAVSATLGDSEVLVHLFRGNVRVDDAELAGEYAAATGGRRAEALRSIGVLSHADNFGSGATGGASSGASGGDAIDQARAAADAIAARMPDTFAAVIAISGLLAQTARTGHLTEADRRTLEAVAGVDPALLALAPQLGLTSATADEVGRLLERLAPFGVAHGGEHAASGVELTRWLTERSGINAVEFVLETQMRPLVLLDRCDAALDALGRVTSDAPAEVRELVAEAAAGPLGQRRRLAEAHATLVAIKPQSPLRADLERALAGVDDATPDELMRRAGDYQARAGAARNGVEAQAARTLSTTMFLAAQSTWREW